MKAKAIVIVLWLVFFVSCGSKTKRAEDLSAPDIPVDWQWHKQADYTIRYPVDWELRENFAGADLCIFSPLLSGKDLFHENISITTEKLVRTMSLEKYAMQAIRTVGVAYKAKAVVEKKYVLNGQVFYDVSFQSDDGWFRQSYHLKEKKAYIVTFWYQPDESGRLKTEGIKVMRSFRLF